MTRRILSAFVWAIGGLLDAFILGPIIDAITTRWPLYIEPPPWTDGTN